MSASDNPVYVVFCAAIEAGLDVSDEDLERFICEEAYCCELVPSEGA